MTEKKIFMYVSLWKEHGGAPGLGLFTFDTQSGEIEPVKQLNDKISFNCSRVDSAHNRMYLCNETDVLEGVNYSSGRIYGYQLDPLTGEVSELFHKETFCPNPAYLNFDDTGKYMIVAHHSSPANITTIERDEDGNFMPVVTFNDSVVELFSMKEDGTIGELLDVKKHESKMPLFDRFGRRTNTHPHCVVKSPSGNLFAVCDKGDGCVYLYTIDREKEELRLCGKYLSDEEGCAPRYCAFHPSLPYLFINHEHEHNGRMTVSAFRYEEDGTMEKIGVYSVLPEGFVLGEGHFEQQGFCIHPSGKYVYSVIHSAYSINCVSVLAVKEESGELELIQNQPIEGVWPRGCALSLDGRFLVTSCLASGDIAVYRVKEDGTLYPTGSKAKLQGGSYISFYKPSNK